MRKVLVSVSHYDTLCREAWNYMEEHGYQIIFDPARKFPAYTTEEIEALPEREDIAAEWMISGMSESIGRSRT